MQRACARKRAAFPLPLLLSVLLPVLLPGLFVGCDDDLPSITLLTQMEVLGARVEVVGDEQRSSPVPGEEVTYELFVAFPERDPDRDRLSMLVIACTAPDRFLGLPICQEFIEAAVAGGGEGPNELPLAEFADGQFRCDDELDVELGPIGLYCRQGAPRVTVPIPADAQGPERLMRGVLCNRGTPVLDPAEPDLFRCVGDGDAAVEELPFFGTIKLAGAEDDRNEHPDLSTLALRLDDEPWEPWSEEGVPGEDACAGESEVLPAVEFGAEVPIEVRYDADARQDYAGRPEVLELSSFATAGEIERRYTVFKPEEPVIEGDLRAEFTWTAPSMAHNDASKRRDPDDPVHFFVTARDRRGGFAVREWYLCVR